MAARLCVATLPYRELKSSVVHVVLLRYVMLHLILVSVKSPFYVIMFRVLFCFRIRGRKKKFAANIVVGIQHEHMHMQTCIYQTISMLDVRTYVWCVHLFILHIIIFRLLNCISFYYSYHECLKNKKNCMMQEMPRLL